MVTPPEPGWNRSRSLYLAIGILICAFGVFMIVGGH